MTKRLTPAERGMLDARRAKITTHNRAIDLCVQRLKGLAAQHLDPASQTVLALATRDLDCLRKVL